MGPFFCSLYWSKRHLVHTIGCQRKRENVSASFLYRCMESMKMFPRVLVQNAGSVMEQAFLCSCGQSCLNLSVRIPKPAANGFIECRRLVACRFCCLHVGATHTGGVLKEAFSPQTMSRQKMNILMVHPKRTTSMQQTRNWTNTLRAGFTY